MTDQEKGYEGLKVLFIAMKEHGVRRVKIDDIEIEMHTPTQELQSVIDASKSAQGGDV